MYVQLKDMDVIVISVKPQDALEVLRNLSFLIEKEKHLVISICAGLDLDTLIAAMNHSQTSTETNRRICRVLPNTPSQIRRGVSVYCLGQDCTEDDRTLVETLMNACGSCYFIQEKQMAAASALSGSGKSPQSFFSFLRLFRERKKERDKQEKKDGKETREKTCKKRVTEGKRRCEPLLCSCHERKKKKSIQASRTTTIRKGALLSLVSIWRGGEELHRKKERERRLDECV